jgi:hypothetical protein
MAARLSTYKVPTEIIVIEQIPKSDTGKVLRREMPDKLEAHLRIRNEPARTVAEASLHEAWMKVLGRSDFGVTDNVFLMGGDPLRADRVGDIVRSTCGVEITVRQLLANPRIRDQAALITREQVNCR